MKEIAVVLGGTLPHVYLVNKLKQRGYRVLLIDYLADPPAKQVADVHIRTSTLAKEEVLRIAKESNARLIISSCVDQANVTAAYVSEKLGLPHSYSYETALGATDKTLMKKKFISGQVPTASHWVIEDLNQLEDLKTSFPLIVKPADSNSSKGVRRVDDDESLRVALTEAFQISRNGKALIEDFIEGVEIGVDFIVDDGVVHYLTSKERIKIPTQVDDVEQISGCVWPSPSFELVKEQVVKSAQNIANEFGFKSTPLMLQGIIRDKQFYVIEFGARLGGGESFRLVHELSGVDYLELSIKTWLGEKFKVMTKGNKYIYGDTFLYLKKGIFSYISGFDEAKQTGLVEYYNLYKNSGASIPGTLSSSDRLGVFVCKAESLAALKEKQMKVMNLLKVYDSQEKDILRRDLYEFNQEN